MTAYEVLPILLTIEYSNMSLHHFSFTSSPLRGIIGGLLLCLSLPIHADDWMANVSDYAYVTQISIPGTHDSATGHGFSGWLAAMGEAYARTQDKTITEQWDNGIRAFDLRPAVDGDKLHIYHGILSTNLDFEEALHTICDLLDQHPTETAIVIIRHEDDADDGDSKWSSLMQALIAEYWMQAHLSTFKPLLTLGEVRGKLLLLSRDSYATYPTGGYIKNWSHSSVYADQIRSTITAKGVSTPCYVQDFYDCSASGAKETKTKAVKNMLNSFATRNKNNRIWCINHTSGYSLTTEFFGNTISSSDGYRDNAATQNQALINLLTTVIGPTGIIMMDYAGTDRSGNYDVNGLSLTQAIIENNNRYEPKGNGIIDIQEPECSQAIYTLSGQKIKSAPSHGLYIQGGKKILVR